MPLMPDFDDAVRRVCRHFAAAFMRYAAMAADTFLTPFDIR